MRKMKTTTVRGVRIEADDLIIGLIDRLMKTERSLEGVREQLKEHMEMIAELQPKLTPEGTLIMRAMSAGEDVAQEFSVIIQPTKIGDPL